MDFITVTVLTCAGLVLFYLAFSFFRRFFRQNRRSKTRDADARSARKLPGRCPLCETILASGEQLKSVVYSGDSGKDRVTHILGCPHCFPYTQEGVVRNCPVCGQKVPAEGFLMGRLFERPDGSRHLHITGCSECHRKNR